MKTGKRILPSVQKFMKSLQDRYHKVLGVLDEALDSENLKDKIWAVELILKRLKPEGHLPSPSHAPNKTPGTENIASSDPPLSPEALKHLSNEELLAEIQGILSHESASNPSDQA